jgi:hypothetical protein
LIYVKHGRTPSATLADMTEESHFAQLLAAAGAQREPQRLLFVFAQGELPAGASAAERARYEAGLGGALRPLVCVDKRPQDLSTFEALVDESRVACPPWQVVFIAALSGRSGNEPQPAVVEQALTQMVENVATGRLGGYMALDAQGEPLQLVAA